jgi:hypothetical protein
MQKAMSEIDPESDLARDFDTPYKSIDLADYDRSGAYIGEHCDVYPSEFDEETFLAESPTPEKDVDELGLLEQFRANEVVDKGINKKLKHRKRHRCKDGSEILVESEAEMPREAKILSTSTAMAPLGEGREYRQVLRDPVSASFDPDLHDRLGEVADRVFSTIFSDPEMFSRLKRALYEESR